MAPTPATAHVSLTHSDIAEIIRLVDQSTLDELVVEIGDLKVEVRRKGAMASPPDAPSPCASASSAPAPSAIPAAAPSREPSAGKDAAAVPSGKPLVGRNAAAPPVDPAVGGRDATGSPDESAAVERGAAASTSGPAIGEGQIAVRSPMVGTFYRRPAPDEPPYVEVGSEVEADTPLCLVEVMKLYTTIYAKEQGRIARICADEADLVEYDQVLFIIDSA